MKTIGSLTFNFRASLAAILVVQTAISPAFAQVAADSNSESPRPFIAYNQTTQRLDIKDSKTQETLLEVDQASPQRIREFSPTRLSAKIATEMGRVKTASKAAWTHSTRNLPTESGVFFLAMGAVVAGQVLFNYAQNPVALQEYLDHQMSPIGSASFFAFMYSQGVTSNILSLYMRNPRLQSLIPYLGMSVGAFVQSGLSQFAADPDVRACAISWTPKASTVDPQSCDRAYERYAVGRQIWEAAPGITSMLTSSLIASVGQNVIRKAALRLTGFDLAMLLAPGGVQVKGLRLLLIKGLQIGVFVAIDNWLAGKINYAWKNVVDGREFDALDSQIIAEGDLKKRAALLKKFHERASEWRAMNLADVYQAHQAWTENLQRVTGMYNASYQFYNSFLNEVRSSKTNANSPLNMIAPLNGITAKGLAKEDADMYFTDPMFVETMQLATAQDVVHALDEKFAKGSFDQEGITVTTQTAIRALRDELATGNREKIGAALLRVQKIVFQETGTSLNDAELAVEMQKIYTQLGAPAPAFEKGRGFVATYETTPTTSASLKDVPFYRRVGVFKTDTVTDYLIASMICGPDIEKGEKAVFSTAGFPGIFTPPTIRKDGIALDAICGRVSTNGVFSPYRTQIAGSPDAIEFLKNNTRDAVLGAQEESRFQTWWEKNTDPQMKKVFDIYAQSYLQIVGNLIAGIFRPDQSHFNTGSMANGTITSLIQEAHVYEGQLNEMLNTGFVPSDSVMNVADFAAGRGAKATPSAYQLTYEQKLKEMIALLKRFSLQKNSEGRVVLVSDLKDTEIPTKKSEIEAVLNQWKDFAQSRGLNEAQKALAQTCLEGLRTIADELALYGQIARAVSTWDEIKNKPATEEDSSLRDRVMDYLRKAKTSLMPNKN